MFQSKILHILYPLIEELILLLKTPSRHKKDKKVVRIIQCGFTEGKSCSTKLINICSEMSGLVDERKTADIVSLGNMVFITFSLKILTEKLLKQSVRCTEN